MTSPSTSSPNKLLVLGASQVGKSFILSALRSDDGSQRRKAGLKLSTRYFDAELELSVVNIDESENSAEALTKEKKEALAKDCQGFVLIFDVQKISTFFRLQQWFQLLQSTTTNLRLLVANTLRERGNAIDEKNETKIREWALDHQMEYVEVAFNDAAKECKETREKLGISRIHEAFCSTMWSHIALKKRGGGGGRGFGGASASVDLRQQQSEDQHTMVKGGCGKEKCVAPTTLSSSLSSSSSAGAINTHMKKNKVLLFGGSSKQRQRLVAELSRLCFDGGKADTADTKARPSASSSSSSSFSHTPLQLRNKYYRATAHIWMTTEAGGGGGGGQEEEIAPVLSTIKENLSKDDSSCKAIIYIVNNPSQELPRELEELFEIADTECNIVFIPDYSSSDRAPATGSKLEDWCLDNGVEIVEEAGATKERGGGGGENGDDAKEAQRIDRYEKFGVARVAEALSCVPWEDMYLMASSPGGESHFCNEEQELTMGEHDKSSSSSSSHHTKEQGDGKKEKAKVSMFTPGDLVEIHGLQAKPHYNSQKARVTGYNEKKERYAVKLLGGKHSKLNIKAKNLRKLGDKGKGEKIDPGGAQVPTTTQVDGGN